MSDMCAVTRAPDTRGSEARRATHAAVRASPRSARRRHTMRHMARGNPRPPAASCEDVVNVMLHRLAAYMRHTRISVLRTVVR
eukprot:542412-Prymnesium_polylepis.1